VINGQFDQALDEISKIDVGSVTNPAIRQDIEFYRFYCQGKLALAGSADTNGAIRGLVAVEKMNPQTFHLVALSELLGELAMAVNQPEQATRYYNRLLAAPDADTKALGLYRLAQVDLARQRTAEAQKRFAQLASASSSSPAMVRLKSLAEVGLAVCDNQTGDSEGALRKLDGLIEKYDSTNQELFARIYNAKGACYLAQDKTVPALLNYLKTDLLYFTEAEAHAEALYYLKQLYPQVGENAKAADAGSRLLSKYASSTWANKAGAN
jgi:tetratricopeptide (TPR) repeat protein